MKGNKLYVGNLSYSTTDDELRELFAEHGTVKDATLILNKGFGFVEMSSPEEAEAAKEALNLEHFGGRNIHVAEARPPKSRPGQSYR